MAPLNILIVGCSIAGPTLATCLLLSDSPASEKPHITILERSSAPRLEGQNIDIRGTGLMIIRKMGLDSAVRSHTTAEDGVQWVDANNKVWAAMAADRSGKFETPTADVEILRGRLAEICWRRSEMVSKEVREEGGTGIEYIFGDYLDQIDQDGLQVHVHFANSGQTRSFDLVVGADGLQSSTRRLVWGAAGEADRIHRLGMYGAFFSMPRAETDGSWRRWFHAPHRRGIMLRPSEQKNKTTVFMYVVNEEDERFVQVASARGKGVETQKKLMQEYFNDAGWESDRVINEMMATDDFYYDFVGQVKMDKWSKGRVVLLGDAGYCASPLSGMGTTLALSGAYNLAGTLMRFPEDLTTALATYEQSMRPIVSRAQKLAPGIVRTMNPETAWGVWALNLLACIIARSWIFKLLVRLKGPPASTAPIEDYGFRQLPEMDARF